MKQRAIFFGTNAGSVFDALEDWIIKNKCNPKTDEEWARALSDLTEAGVLAPLGTIDAKDTDEFKKGLKEHYDVTEPGLPSDDQV